MLTVLHGLLLGLLPWGMGVGMLYALLYLPQQWHHGHHLIAIGSGAYLGHVLLAVTMNQLQGRNLSVFSEWLLAWGLLLILCSWVIGQLLCRRNAHAPPQQISTETATPINGFVWLLGGGLVVWLAILLLTTTWELAVRPAVAWDTTWYWTIDTNRFLTWQLSNPEEGSVRIGYLHPTTLHLIHAWSAWVGFTTGSSSWLFLPSFTIYLGSVLTAMGVAWVLSRHILFGLVAGITIASLPLFHSQSTLAGYAEPWIAAGLVATIGLLLMPTRGTGKLVLFGIWLCCAASMSAWKGESLAYSLIAITALGLAATFKLKQRFFGVALMGTLVIGAGILIRKGFELRVFGAPFAWLPDQNLLRLGRRSVNAEFVDSAMLMDNLLNAWIMNSSFSLAILAALSMIIGFVFLIASKRSVSFATYYAVFVSIGAIAFLVLSQGFSEYLLTHAAPDKDTIFSRSSNVGMLSILIAAFAVVCNLRHPPKNQNNT